MSGRRTIPAAVALLALALAAPAAAQPPIVRPPGAGSLSAQELGRQLFAGNCARCHGSRGQGIDTAGPSLLGVGRLASDFYLRTGYMPLADSDEQPQRRRVELSDREIRALEDYVDSFGGGPPVPSPRPQDGSVSHGLELFTEHCAGCHQVVAEGGVVTGARVPPLDRATPVQVAQAVRIGPYLMPSFSKTDISDRELDSIVAYVRYAQHPDDRGGWGIGHLGPFPEGMVTWLIAAIVLVATCVLIGERLRS
jgi:ubiquinol-cytochrome c reductase cytochrome c subunit